MNAKDLNVADCNDIISNHTKSQLKYFDAVVIHAMLIFNLMEDIELC